MTWLERYNNYDEKELPKTQDICCQETSSLISKQVPMQENIKHCRVNA